MSAFPESEGSLTWETVARIRTGDRAAWDELYARYHDELLFAIRCRLGSALRSHLESEDILQSVMLDALARLERLPDGEDSLRHLLHVMIANKIRDRADTFAAAKRKGTVALPETIAESLSGPEGPLRYRDHERYERLERCMDRLPEEMRTVLVLRKIDGLPSKAVAERLGSSDAAVRKLVSRALARLTALMEAEDPA